MKSKKYSLQISAFSKVWRWLIDWWESFWDISGTKKTHIFEQKTILQLYVDTKNKNTLEKDYTYSVRLWMLRLFHCWSKRVQNAVAFANRWIHLDHTFHNNKTCLQLFSFVYNKLKWAHKFTSLTVELIINYEL